MASHDPAPVIGIHQRKGAEARLSKNFPVASILNNKRFCNTSSRRLREVRRDPASLSGKQGWRIAPGCDGLVRNDNEEKPAGIGSAYRVKRGVARPAWALQSGRVAL